MKTAIYARYSSDRQRETSIDDQVRLCRLRADSEGWEIVAVHSDQEVSGSTPIAFRAGASVLLAEGLAGRYDVMIVEGLDRLSRDSVEQEQTVRRLEHRGVRLIGISDGYDSESGSRRLTRGVRGLINEVYLQDLARKTHRGLAGQFSRGLSAGGLAYGYRSVERDGGRGLEIDNEQAAWVVWIYERCAEGWSARRIAQELNARGIPGARGGTWAVGAIYGHPAKGTGILRNETYIGRLIWNRSRFVKDPDTGRRKRIERPRSEWMVREATELRIVSDELWRVVRTRMGKTAGKSTRGAPPSTLLGGLMQCGICGAPVVAVDKYNYGCSHARDRGQAVCAGVHVKRTVAEERLLAFARDELLGPEQIREFQREAQDYLRMLTRGQSDADQHARRRLDALRGEIDRLTDAVATMGLSEALRERLAAAEAEKQQIEATLRKEPAPDIPHLIPRLMERCRAALADIDELRRRPEQARQSLRDVLGTVRLVPEDGKVIAEIGCYEGLALKIAGKSAQTNVVAGAGFGYCLRRIPLSGGATAQ